MPTLEENIEELWDAIFIGGIKTEYDVSNMGKYRSNKYGKTKILKPGWRGRKGQEYICAYLYLNGIRYIIDLQVLVATYFIPNPLNLPEVNHKRGNKKDNRASELEWCTEKENVQHAFNIGLRKAKEGSNHPLARKIAKIFAGIILKEYPTLAAARVDGYTSPCLCQAAKNGKIYKGFFWKYLN